ncbi:phage tail protein [Pseudomonas frederiksbergensis]|uniref:phage tail protein n=1 Tax=Pseudomonas frederiksbergensis TaxID=104087 RepID=UPI003D021CD4
MADTETVKKSVLLTGIDELSPKLAGLVSKVDSFKKNLEQAGLGKLDISGLFKGGSVITPFVDGIKASDAFKGKLAEVSESAKAVDLPSAPASATQTMNVFSQSMGTVSAAIDAALMPAVASLVVGLEPMLSSVGTLLSENPKLVEGLAAGAVAFSAIQTAVSGATQVFDLMSTVMKTNPIMLIAMGIAVAAGLIVANWKPVSTFFVGLWQKIAPVVMPMVEFFKTMFSFTPLGQLISNWGPVTAFFASLWRGIQAVAVPAFELLKTLFSWTPQGLILSNWGAISSIVATIFGRMKDNATEFFGFLKACFDWTPQGMILNNWGPVTGLFAAIWDLLVALAVPVKDMLRSVFNDYVPMDRITELWGKVPDFFGGMVESIDVAMRLLATIFGIPFVGSPLDAFNLQWAPLTKGISDWVDKIQALMAPIKDMFGGSFGGFITLITGKIEGLTEAQKKTNAEGKGELAPAFFGASTEPLSATELAPGNLPQKPSMLTSSLTQNSSALIQQTAANNRTQLEGGLTVRFDNAPAGLRTDQPQTNQPGLALNSRIGYRSLSLGGSNELA